MDVSLLVWLYGLPLLISAVGGLLEFKKCRFDTAGHAFNKAFFLTFRSLVPALNIVSAMLYLVTCGTFTYKKLASSQTRPD